MTDPAEPAAATDAAATDWTGIWTAAQQLTEPGNLPQPPFTHGGIALLDATLRQTARVTADAGRLRVRLSNACSETDLVVGRACLALPRDGRAGVAAVAAGTSVPLTFAGRPSVTIAAGADTVSDPLDFKVTAGANVTVSCYLPYGQQTAGGVTGHPGSRTTSHILPGDHAADADLPGSGEVDHWYFLSGIEASGIEAGPGHQAAVACIGDSLTDGRGSTTNGNDRWPDQFLDRLRAEADGTGSIAVLNQGIGGNHVIEGGLGPAIMSRFDRDVLAVPGVRWLIVFAGVNDIGGAAATAEAQRQVAADLCEAYGNITLKAHRAGIKVYGATITPFGGNEAYDDPGGHRKAARQSVNAWIRSGGAFDAVLDFDAAVRDSKAHGRLRPDYHDGDWLHLSPEGYRALANAVPFGLFR